MTAKNKEAVLHFNLEGIDGAGKSTSLPLIAQKLRALGYTVIAVTSPSHSPKGEFIRANVRELPPAERNRLFIDDIETTIASAAAEAEKEAQPEGRPVVVLWDRYIDSFYASNREMSLDEADDLVGGLPRPTATFLLSIEPERIFTERSQALDHHSDPQWLRAKELRYMTLATREPDRFDIIDAGLPTDEVAQTIADRIVARLPA